MLLGARQPGAMAPQNAGQKKSFQTMQEMAGMSGMDNDHHKESEVTLSNILAFTESALLTENVKKLCKTFKNSILRHLALQLLHC